MNIFEQIVTVIAPYECIACGLEGKLLCSMCQEKIQLAAARCYRCSAASVGCLTCTSCCKASSLKSVRAATAYTGLGKDLVWRLKFFGARETCELLAKYMLPLINPNEDSKNCVIVPLSTATSRVRQRGYDQSKLIARKLASRTHISYVDCLSRLGQAHQVGATRQERLLQLEGAFRVRKSSLIKGCRIILVDDVVTTGATLEAAAAALKTAGAAQVEALVFAQA